MDAIDTIRKGDYTIKIYQDDNPYNPRENDNLGTMVCWHRRYNLGDEQPKLSPDEYLCNLAGIEYSRYEGPTKPDMQRVSKWLDEHVVILDLYLYDHGGITISTSGFYDIWDSGQVGFIYIDKDKIRKEYGAKHVTKQLRERIAGYLRAEVQEYDNYLTGSVYGYKIIYKDAHGNEEELDSVWGFYGYDHKKSGLLDEANSTINHHHKHTMKQIRLF